MTSDTRLIVARTDLADERLRGLVEAARFVPGRPRRVVAPSCAVRRAPRADAPLETEALMGEAVTVYDEEEGWAWAQLGRDGYVGYLPADALGPDGPEPTHRVAALRTFVFPGPDLKLPPLGHLPLGAGASPVDVRGGYVRLAASGWVWGAHLAPVDLAEPDWVAVAERLLGVPYLWGGKTPIGLDCSGLVQLALARGGVAAPRDADMQEGSLGRPVPMDNDLRRGDLVFWRGHVGIMRDGERLLHANGHHMAVASEALAEAARRIETAGAGRVTSVRRLG